MSAPKILLILAAGKSRRYGRDKRFEQMPKGGAVLPALVRRGKKAGLRVIAVLDAKDDVSERLQCEIVLSEHAEGGMGCSLADAIASLGRGEAGLSGKDLSDTKLPETKLPDTVLIMPADLPLLRVSSLRNVAASATADNIVVPHFAGQRGHPVAIGRRFWPELLGLRGDVGARSVIAAHAGDVVSLALDDAGICADGDTPEAMSALFAKMTPP